MISNIKSILQKASKMEIPILAYHASNISGNVYHLNDHIAFESDLYTIHHQGFKIIPLKWIAEWVLGKRDLTHIGDKLVGLSCDDGLDLDYKNGEYFNFGPQISFYHIMKKFIEDVGEHAQPHINLTSFVIASPDGRKKIDDVSLKKHDLLNENWWHEANETGLIDIENHSWDHRHPDIYSESEANFTSVLDFETANKQIIEAKSYIDLVLEPSKTSLFAYPWGHVNDYLLKEFLPNEGVNSGIEGAFTCGAKKVKKNTSRWELPRYICGFNWKSPNGLVKILNH